MRKGVLVDHLTELGGFQSDNEHALGFQFVDENVWMKRRGELNIANKRGQKQQQLPILGWWLHLTCSCAPIVVLAVLSTSGVAV